MNQAESHFFVEIKSHYHETPQKRFSTLLCASMSNNFSQNHSKHLIYCNT